MAELVRQERVGACAFVDVMEEAALRGTPVEVVTVDGASFTDVVEDVITRGGINLVKLRTRGELPAADVAAMGRAARR